MMQHSSIFTVLHRLTLALVLAWAGVAWPSLSGGATINSTWIGGTGNWSVGGNWSGSVVPDNTATDFYNVRIDNDTGTDSVVTTITDREVDSVTIDSGDQLTIGNSDDLVIVRDAGRAASGQVSNAGLIITEFSGYLRFNGDLNLSGGGEVQLYNSSLTGIYATLTNGRLTNVDNTIRGSGTIGGSLAEITNSGVIQADQSAALTVSPGGGSNFNTGTMQATGGRFLNLHGDWDNTGGMIAAQDNSTVSLFGTVTGGSFTSGDGAEIRLQSDSSITGATLGTSGSGVVTVFSSSSSPAVLDTVTNSGNIFINNGDYLSLITSLNNSGEVEIGSFGSSTGLRIDGDVALSGGGDVVLSDSSRDNFWAITAGDKLTNVDNTIRGYGNVGLNSMAIDNQGNIQAETGGTLTVNPHGTANINSGTIGSAGGNLALSGTWDNSSGTVEVQASSNATFSGDLTGGGFSVADGGVANLADNSRITGATLSTAGSGEFRVTSSSSNPAVFESAINQGYVRITNGDYLTLETSLNNSGTIEIDASGSSTAMRIDGDVTLSGGGNVVLSNASRDFFFALTSGDKLTNLDNTIRGFGTVGNNSMAIDNQGVIQAETGGVFNVNPQGAANTNSGMIYSTAGGNMNLAGGWDNTGGTIQAQAGGVLTLSGDITDGAVSAADTGVFNLSSSTITGATLSTAGSGEFRITSTNFFSPAALVGVTNTGAIEQLDGRYFTIADAINNSGTITLNGAASSTAMRIDGDVSLSGGGDVVLQHATRDFFYAVNAGDTLTNIDNTIRGIGRVGNGSMAINNQGTIQAVGTGTLEVRPHSSSGVNTGMMYATGGATLSIDETWNNTGGQIEAQASSTVTLLGDITGGSIAAASAATVNLDDGSSVTGATFSTTGTGKIVATSSSSNPALLDGVTNTGALDIANSQYLNLANSLNNSGTVTLASTGSYAYLRLTTDLTLSGGGQVILNDNANNNFHVTTAGLALTNADNTIRGTGGVGGGNMVFFNDGIIEADGAGTLTVWSHGTTSTNTGTIRSSGSGTLLLDGTWDNTDGVVAALDGSTARIQGNISNGMFQVADGGLIDLDDGGAITSGMLSSAGTGKFLVTGSGSSYFTLDSATNTGDIEVANGNDLYLANSLNNSGTLAVNATTSSGTDIWATTDLTLTGGGEVVFNNSNYARIFGQTTGLTLTNVDNTLRGIGVVGSNSLAFDNQSVIEADTAGTMSLSYPNVSNTNSGVLRASGGGTMVIDGDWNNGSGQIAALANSTVDIEGEITGGTFSVADTGVGSFDDGAVLSGVTLSSTGTGKFLAQASSTPSLLENVVNSGDIELENGRYLNLSTSLENSGTLTVNSTGSSTYLRIVDDTSLTSGGEVVLTHSSRSYFYRVSGSPTLTNVDNTIRGVGLLGLGSMRIINQGTIQAEGSGSLTVDTPSTTNTHDGLFRATTGATLIIADDFSGSGSWDADGGRIQLNSGVDALTSGSIQVRNGGELELNNANISGSNLIADSTATLDIGSTISLTGDFSFAMTDESDWDWSTSGILEMNGGQGANTANWNNWVKLEIGGTNLGIDAVLHSGAAAGFANSNFYLPRLVVGSDAHVVLVDLLNNGNRFGAFGDAEALYVSTLEFTDGAGLLNINGLDLYYDSLIGNPNQIIDLQASFSSAFVPEPNSLVCLVMILPILRRRRVRSQRFGGELEEHNVGVSFAPE